MARGAAFQSWLKNIVKGNLLILTVGVAVTTLMVIMYVSRPAFLSLLDKKLYDSILASEHNEAVTGVPAIVDLDEHSLQEYGQWPWPRYRVALLLKKITELGAASVGLDVVFAEPDRTSPVVLQKDLGQDLKVNLDFSGLPPQLMDNDKVLARELASGPYVLGYPFNFETPVPGAHGCELIPLNAAVLRTPGAAESTLYQAPDVICNLPVLNEAAPASGFFSTVPDQDGVLRSTPLVIEWNGELYPSLSLASLMLAKDINQIILKMGPDGVESLKIRERVVPVDPQGRMLIHYRGGSRTFPYYSAADVLQNKLPKDALKDNIVFLGTSAAGLKDLRSTPLASVYPGVEAHATVVDNILAGDFISRPYWAPGLEASLIVVFGVLSTVLLFGSRAVLSVIPLAVCAAGAWFGSVWLFRAQGMFVSPLMPLITLGLNFTGLTLFKYIREEGHKKFLHSTFQSYLSPELIDEIIDSNKVPELGGETRNITAYFTDIQSFSTFSEILTAQQLVELLNEYLSAMTDILMEENGTLDKYEGDAIVAFFGAPITLPDHTLRACRAALAMQRALLQLREKWLTETVGQDEPERNVKNLPPERWAPGAKWPYIVHNMRMRIGLNSGEIVVGNMGSSMRMNYTMMGDSVNLAARLEAAAKQYGIFTMISEYSLHQTFANGDGAEQKVADLVEVRFLDNIAVVGKSEPVKVYELWALKGELTAEEEELRNRFNAGLNHYFKMQWDDAIQAFEKAEQMERFPTEKTTPSRVFIERCKLFKDSPPVEPGQTWDGVYRLTKK